MIRGLFLFVLVMTVILGSILVYTHYYEGEDIVCKSPEIKSGAECCLDADFNNICDSKQLLETTTVENVMNEITDANEIGSLRQKVKYLEGQVEYYETVVSQLVNERDYYERLYRQERSDSDDNDDEWDLKVIVEDEDGFEVEDAYVRIDNGDTEVEHTDDDGEAVFRNIEEDCYEIRVKADGYQTEEKDRCIDDDETVRFTLEYD